MAISSRLPHRLEKSKVFSETGGENTSAAAEEEDEKPRTLFVGNVPREVHKREIEEIFGEIGPLKRCYIQYPRDGNEKKKQREDTTVAYVTFALSQDATQALETLQNSKIGSNRINIKFAKTRSDQVRQTFGNDRAAGRFQRSANLEPVAGAAPKVKEPRPKAIKKKSRLIVRNLSFKVTEDKLKEYFQSYGDIKDINILKKPNGKLVGCAFIQYQNVFQAAKAIKELNLKPFLGRPIAIDWALPKEKYQTDEEKTVKEEENDGEDEGSKHVNETIEIKDEPASEVEDNSSQYDALDAYQHLKEEPMDIEEVKQEFPHETKHSVGKRKIKSEDDENSEEDLDDFSDDDDESCSPKKRPKKQLSNDVEEGKTLFLRNLPFDVTEDELKEFFEKFGQLRYAVLCKDSLTEHPKGTGFVKFAEKSSADDCLEKFEEDESDFKLKRRQISISVAVSREKAEQIKKPFRDSDSGKKDDKNNSKPKSDSRNLYLVREGFVRPGSGAAADVSATDMSKRAALNKVKKQMLKNLNIFISPTRLCIHNLPPTFSDKQLRKLCAKYAGPGAKITEARIMRDMKDIGLNGKGKSKGFGFVNFAQHDHALTALRAINNNPEVFKSNSRPIVEFSLENRMAIKAKERRAQKSKEKNPTLQLKNQSNKKTLKGKGQDANEGSSEEASESSKPPKGKGSHQKGVKKNQDKNSIEDAQEKVDQAPKYAGLVAKKGVQTVPSFKPKGKITRNSLKPKKSKKQKKLLERKQREPKLHSKRPIEKMDKTEKIITKYKQKLESADKPSRKQKKWFQ